MKTKSLFAALLLAAGMLGTSSIAHADDTITLGRTILLGKSNHGAEIPLVMCRRVDAIKVKAERDMFLERVKVTFQNKETRTFKFYRKVGEDKKTDWRKFAYKRCVTHIEVFGKATGSSAGVRIFGRQ